MGKIAIVTDSVSDIPDDIIKLYDIYVVPLTVDIDGIYYKDGIDIKKRRILRFDKFWEDAKYFTSITY